MTRADGNHPVNHEAGHAHDTRVDLGLGMRVSLVLYEIAWFFLLPIAFFLLWRRGKREPIYRQFWGERFGNTINHLNPRPGRPLWIHSASLGEMRGAAPLVQALLEQRFNVVITTLTPAGRSSAQALFAEAIASGQAQVCFAPIEQTWAIKRFIAHFNPRCALMTEIDTWPLLISTTRRAKNKQGLAIQCGIANAQYPKQSLARDLRWGGFRAKLFRCYQLVLCKSDTHAQRFRQVGCQHVVVAGETRFDLPVPQDQLKAAAHWLFSLGLSCAAQEGGRAIICIASSVAGEEAQFLQAYRLIQAAYQQLGKPKPLFIHVPRNTQLFEPIYQTMVAQGFAVARRSDCLDANLTQRPDQLIDVESIDILLGDSLREMYFYLSLAMVVVVGGSFVPLGSHNIIEPLGLKKPVMVGPSIWGIEYPGVEALAAGVLEQHQTIAQLAQAIVHLLTTPSAYAKSIAHADTFYSAHAGATKRHLAALKPWIPEV